MKTNVQAEEWVDIYQRSGKTPEALVFGLRAYHLRLEELSCFSSKTTLSDVAAEVAQQIEWR